MVKKGLFSRALLRHGTALRAVALLGAGVGGFGFASVAEAQDFTQVNATGRVQGTDGKPLAGATVTVTSNTQGFSRTVTTDSDGSYRVPALPIGVYTFVVSASGFDSFIDRDVNLNQSSAANQFTLGEVGAGGEIVVTAGRVQVADFDRNTVGAVVQVGELAARVPVSRDLTRWCCWHRARLRATRPSATCPLSRGRRFRKTPSLSTG